jgi:hypothetical protein
MGITIGNKNRSIDLGMGGYNNLRNRIAKLLDEDLYNVYSELTQFYKYRELGFKSEQDFFDAHDAAALKICEEKKLDSYVVNFLYLPDYSEESVSHQTCRHLWRVIKDYDDNILYGYIGRPDCAMFKDFKRIVEECAKNRWVMRFS